MDAHARSPRVARAPSDDQRFLRSASIARELVRDAAFTTSEHVVEIGAGDGRLTQPLAAVAGRVTAYEVDPSLADGLRRRFGGASNVSVVCRDFLEARPPRGPWRAFGNIPFSRTTAILRRLLDDPLTGPERADLLMQFEAARKRAAPFPNSLLTLGWLPWWEMSLVRRLPRLCFEPPPSVDAGLLTIRRRPEPLLAARDRPAYLRLLRRGFDHGSWPVRRSLRDVTSPKTWKRLARDRGLDPNALPRDLDVWDWVGIFTIHTPTWQVAP